MSNESDPIVQYTVKEILTRLEGKFDNLTETILKQVMDLGERVAAIEHQQSNNRASRAGWRDVLIVLGTLAMAGTAIYAMLARAHG